jgi:RNA polymerase sigma factor (sigma-70 family)
MDELARQAQAGDEDALRRLLEEFEPIAQRIAARYAHHPDEKPDLAQLARIKAWRALKTWDPSRIPFVSYASLCARKAVQREAFVQRTPASGVYSQLARVAAGQMRPVTRVELSDQIAGAETPDLLDRVEVERLHVLITGAPPADRELLNWRYPAGGAEPLTLREIASRLGCSPQTVANRLDRALERLRSRAGAPSQHRDSRDAA